jgi:hypothetical protein
MIRERRDRCLPNVLTPGHLVSANPGCLEGSVKTASPAKLGRSAATSLDRPESSPTISREMAPGHRLGEEWREARAKNATLSAHLTLPGVEHVLARVTSRRRAPDALPTVARM